MGKVVTQAAAGRASRYVRLPGHFSSAAAAAAAGLAQMLWALWGTRCFNFGYVTTLFNLSIFFQARQSIWPGTLGMSVKQSSPPDRSLNICADSTWPRPRQPRRPRRRPQFPSRLPQRNRHPNSTGGRTSFWQQGKESGNVHWQKFRPI